jgi:hypothetical protein
MSKNKKPLSRKDEIVVQEVDGEVLIYDLRANKAFCLNETSALIWHACDGSRDVPALSKFVTKRLNAPANEDLVWLALDQLAKEKLLDAIPESDGRFAGMSRREVIRKVGLGAAISIPVVAGLVAPQAIHANSLCMTVVNGCVCNGGPFPSPTDCTTNQMTACADTNCRCVTNGGMAMGEQGDCVP